MNIPDEAVEAAVAVYLGLGYPGSYDEVELGEIRVDIRTMLEAALPLIPRDESNTSVDG